MPITTTYATSTSFPIATTGSVISAQFANTIVQGIQSILGRQNQDAYQLSSYFSIPVNTSTRVTARGYNTMLSDLDLIWQHYSGSTVTNTTTRLTAYHDAWVVNTGSLITADHWNHLSEAMSLAQVNQFNLHPAQLSSDDNGCIVVYDQSVVERNQTWGTGTDQSITMRLRAEWSTSTLANSFFNLGSEFVFSPFYSSMSLRVDDPAASGLVGYQFQTTGYQQGFVPVSIFPQGSDPETGSAGFGPMYHVDTALHPYGTTSTYDPFLVNSLTWDYYGAPSSGNVSFLSQNPDIVGTPFQLVGLHYQYNTTRLVIGCQYGQDVPTTATNLRVTLDGGVNYYDVAVPGRYGKLAPGQVPPSPPTTESGWWLYQYDSGTESFDYKLYGWIEIYTGVNGADPIGLNAAINDQLPHTISIVPTGTGASTASTGTTATNAWAQFIDELNTGTWQSYVYDRAKWLDNSYQTTTTTFSTLLNPITVTVAATRNSPTPGLSSYIEFAVTATNANVGQEYKYYTPYNYITSVQTCTNTANLNNSFEAARNAYTSGSGGGGGGGFPWWIVVGGGILAATGVCFTGDTLVLLEDGTRVPIRDIQPGVRVWNHDRSRVNTVLFVEEKYKENVPVYAPKLGVRPFITDNHPIIIDGEFWTFDPEKHWELYPWLGTAHHLPDCQVGILNGETVYNLWLDGDHTYHVNDWATHSIIDDGAFLRLSVEQQHITKTATIEILEAHTASDKFLLTGSYYVNRWLGMINSTQLNDFMAKALSGPDGVKKSILRNGMRVVGSVARPYLWAKFKLLKQKYRL